jgi:hypothetical protein
MFSAESEVIARLVAARLFDTCCDIAARYELWSGVRPIASGPAIGVESPVLPAPDPDTERAAEAIAVERLSILRESRSARIRSRRLLAEVNSLQSALLRSRVTCKGG